MRSFIAKILYVVFYFRISKEKNKTDSILTIYGHDVSHNSFEELIEWLIKQGYSFINHFELYDYLNGQELDTKKNVWLSFDDGWKGNYDNVLPVLKKFNIPATIFIATKGIEDGYYWFEKAKENRNSGYYKEIQDLWEMSNSEREIIIENLEKKKLERTTMLPKEIEEMTSSGVVFWGNHTHDHVISDKCTTEELKEQILLCQTKVKEWTDADCNFIYSYPNGNRDERSGKLIKEMGFSMAVTTELGRTFRDTSPYEIPRCEFKDNATLKENILQIYGIWTSFFNGIKGMFNIVNKK